MSPGHEDVFPRLVVPAQQGGQQQQEIEMGIALGHFVSELRVEKVFRR
jgi:hypothetical protein